MREEALDCTLCRTRFGRAIYEYMSQHGLRNEGDGHSQIHVPAALCQRRENAMPI